MRLWHINILKYLPRLQRVSQWKELNSIFKNQVNHILINYVYDYDKDDLYTYSVAVMNEFSRRGYKIKDLSKFNDYFLLPERKYTIKENPFKYHHNDRYLIQCFYNLQEKYDRGQVGFTEEIYKELKSFIKSKNLVIDI